MGPQCVRPGCFPAFSDALQNLIRIPWHFPLSFPSSVTIPGINILLWSQVRSFSVNQQLSFLVLLAGYHFHSSLLLRPPSQPTGLSYICYFYLHRNPIRPKDPQEKSHSAQVVIMSQVHSAHSWEELSRFNFPFLTQIQKIHEKPGLQMANFCSVNLAEQLKLSVMQEILYPNRMHNFSVKKNLTKNS